MSNFVKSKFGTILVLIATVILAGIAIFTAVRLYKLRQEAIAPTAPTSKPAAAGDLCPAAEACPDTDGVLRNCHPPDSDGTSEDSICNTSARGRVKFCGTRNYCCNGTSWTATMTACASTSPSSSPSTNPSSNPVQCEALSFNISIPSTSPSASPSVSPSPSGTGTPNSCGGTCGSNSNCASGLVCYSGYCRNSSCTSETDCICPTSTSTATARPTSTATAAPQAELPEAGTSLPTIIGLGSGLILILISLIIAL